MPSPCAGEKESTSCRLPLRGLSSPPHRLTAAQGRRVEQRAILARTRCATALRLRERTRSRLTHLVLGMAVGYRPRTDVQRGNLVLSIRQQETGPYLRVRPADPANANMSWNQKLVFAGCANGGNAAERWIIEVAGHA